MIKLPHRLPPELLMAVVLLATMALASTGKVIGAASTTGIAGPFESYILGVKDEQVSSPVPFVAERVFDGESLGVGPFLSPEKLFIDGEGFVYVVDKGNSRVVKMTQDGEVVLQFGNPPEGLLVFGASDDPLKVEYLNEPSGVFIAGDGTIFIADTGNQRIAVYEEHGRFLYALGELQSELLGEDFVFRPSKVVVDMAGLLYVINSEDYRGLMQISPEGEFLGWYAPNRLPLDVGRILARILATAEQISQLAKPLPPPHASVFIDDRGFLWTVSVFERRNQIKRLVSGGKNVFPEDIYGQILLQGWRWALPRFVDIFVDKREIVTVIDQGTSLIYQYNLDGDLLLVYGCKGIGKGRFQEPSSVIVDDTGRIWVLDAGTGMIQVLRPTEFANRVYEASALYIDGFYEESADVWQEILSVNANYRLARKGLGLSYFKQERWEDAMHQFYLGRYRDEYSKAFGEHAREFVRDHFLATVIVVVLLCFLVYGLIWAWKAGVQYAIREVYKRWQ